MKDADLIMEIKEFMKIWTEEKHFNFMNDVSKSYFFYEMFQKDKNSEILKKNPDELMFQMLMTVYLVSKFADHHAVKLNTLNLKFKEFWRKIEKHIGIETTNDLPT